MLALVTIISHIIYAALGRALVEKRRRDETLLYADWFIASASAYFLCRHVLGYFDFLFDNNTEPFIHLSIGFVALVVVDIIRFRAPRAIKLAFRDIFRLLLKVNHAIMESARESRIARYMVGILILGYAYFIYKGISVPPHEYDALSYHIPLTIDIFRENSLIPPPDRYWHFYFPANFELWFSTWLFTGRASSLVLAQLLCTIPLGLMSYLLARSLGASKSTSVLSALVLLGAPIIMFQSITPMNELFCLPFLVCVLLYSIEYTKNGRLVDAFYSGLSLGLAVGTKYTYLPLVLVVPISVFVALIYKRQSNDQILKKWFFFTVTFIAMVFVVSSFWYIRNFLIKGNPFFPLEFSIFGNTIFNGISTVFDPNFELNFVPSRLHWFVYPWIEGRYSAYQGLGYAAGAIGSIAMIVILLSQLRRQSGRPIAAFLLVFLVISILSWWRLTQHEPRFLIFILPLLAYYSVSFCASVKIRFNLNYLILLIIFAMTVGKSIATVKQDIRGLAYDGDFLRCYGLSSDLDEWSPRGTTLLLSDGSYGHLLVYPLSGQRLARRVIIIGLDKIKNDDELTALLLKNASIIPGDIDHVLYFAWGDERRINPEKVMRLKLDSIYKFSGSKSDFIFAPRHKVYSYVPVSSE